MDGHLGHMKSLMYIKYTSIGMDQIGKKVVCPSVFLFLCPDRLDCRGGVTQIWKWNQRQHPRRQQSNRRAGSWAMIALWHRVAVPSWNSCLWTGKWWRYQHLPYLCHSVVGYLDYSSIVCTLPVLLPANTSHIVIWSVGLGVGILVLLLILQKKLSTTEYDVSCRLIIHGLYYIEVHFFYTQFVQSFYPESMLHFVKCFMYII